MARPKLFQRLELARPVIRPRSRLMAKNMQRRRHTTNYKFTGYERDAETGLDYAFARYYSSRLGRFMSTDPLAGDLTDPQSLNRYAYVYNNPSNNADPSGLYCGVGYGCNQGSGGFSYFDLETPGAGWSSYDPGDISSAFYPLLEGQPNVTPNSSSSFVNAGPIIYETSIWDLNIGSGYSAPSNPAPPTRRQQNSSQRRQ
jgi:RHS repeat-associated protein